MTRLKLTEVELWALGDFVWSLWCLHGEKIRLPMMAKIFFKTCFQRKDPSLVQNQAAQRLMRAGIGHLKGQGEEFGVFEVIFEGRGPLKINGQTKLIPKLLEISDDWDLEGIQEGVLIRVLSELGLPVPEQPDSRKSEQ